MVSEEYKECWLDLIFRPDNFYARFEQLERIVDDGFDINSSVRLNRFGRPYTPLQDVIEGHCRLKMEHRQQLLQFLLLHGAVPDERDLEIASDKPKLFEQLLYFAQEEHIRIRCEHLRIVSCLEILLGFSNVSLDQEMPRVIYYVNDYSQGCHQVYSCLPIEVCLMDCAQRYGSETLRHECLQLLKKHGSPSPRLELMEEMIQCIGDRNEAIGLIGTTSARLFFQDALHYWNSI